MSVTLSEYLKPTSVIDSDHPVVVDYAKRIDTGKDQVAHAIKLYLAVRDDIRYDPYAPCSIPNHFRASFVIERGRSFCIPKASLLCALGRACGIPSRVGFANVRNHLATKQLLDLLGTNIFVYHGFVEFYLEGKWVKCTPAFNRELCQKHGVPALEFDGHNDSLFQPYNSENRKYMEYIEYLGTFSDIPVSLIVEALTKTYGEKFFEDARRISIGKRDNSASDFDKEDIWKE